MRRQHSQSNTPPSSLNRRNLSSTIPVTTTSSTTSSRSRRNNTTASSRPPVDGDATTQRLTRDVMKRFLVISVISSAIFMTLNISMLWHQHIKKMGRNRLTHAEEFFSSVGFEFTQQDGRRGKRFRGGGTSSQHLAPVVDEEEKLLMNDAGEGRIGTAPYIRSQKYRSIIVEKEEITNTVGLSPTNTVSSTTTQQQNGGGGSGSGSGSNNMVGGNLASTGASAPASNNMIDILKSDQQKPWIIQRQGPKPPLRRAKVIMGIISADVPNDKSYRKRHRDLFTLWNDKRVCALHEFEDAYDLHGTNSTLYQNCELIWTFIVGGNTDPSGQTELVSHSETNPILVPKPIEAKAKDINDPDTSLLNIRENMNEGKSQTFLYFSSLLMEKYGIDYAMKCDADSILHLHDYFLFAHRNLPPAPYNTNIYVGALRDKAYWPKHSEEEIDRFESFFGTEFEGVHLYLAGQNYILSQDLATFVSKEAQYSKGYIEGHEDHDISAMAFHAPQPVHMVTIGKSQRFWEHPVKGEPRWKRIWKRENCRMQQVPFEGKMLRLYLE